MIEMTREEYKELELEIKNMEEKLKSLKSEFEDVKIIKWEETEDEFDINKKITVVSNYSSWEKCKSILAENEKKEMLFIYIHTHSEISSSTTLTLQLSEMKELKKYLEEKIDYLEAK